MKENDAAKNPAEDALPAILRGDAGMTPADAGERDEKPGRTIPGQKRVVLQRGIEPPTY